ncbi:MAG: Shedu anti-phage system protein SduA domain-containing protein [Gaiellaceae bacterium]
MLTLDLDWDVPLKHRKGGETRLCGIDVYHEFEWLHVFPDRRTQFKNGQCLAKFVQEECPEGKTPALLLTLRDGLRQGFRHTPNFLVFVVNIEEYRTTAGDAARSYLAGHLGVDVTEIDELQELAESADPGVLRAFIESHVDLGHITAWVADNEERLEQLRELIGTGEGAPSSLADTLTALGALGDISAEDAGFISEFFGSASTREQRIELLRAVTADPSGRYVTSEVLAERTPQRIQDAREAMDDYQALLDDDATNETTMQKFIEKNLWLLGLDYAVMRRRKPGPSGAMDFLLQRYDGFHDLLELKSPHDELIKAPDVADDDPAPSPHEYALSTTLAQALAQAIVYRDRLTRYADAAKELYGLPYTRDPRLIIVIGKADPLPEHRKRVLLELNKSLHRVEVVPYDVLAKRANAVLDNVELYLLAAHEASALADEELPD